MPIATAPKSFSGLSLFESSVSLTPHRERTWLQSDLLGQPAGQLLAWPRLEAEVQRGGQATVTTLHLFAPQSAASRRQQVDDFIQCLSVAMRRLQHYALGHAVQGARPVGSVVALLRDAMHFLAMAETALHIQGQVPLLRCAHLVGLALVRYKLEAHWGLHGKQAVLLHGEPGRLCHDEVAAACELQPASLRNAMSRGELEGADATSIPVEAALDWMLTRQHFLFLSVARQLPSRQINGKVASLWLDQQPGATRIKQISRLRMELWHLGETAMPVGVNTGVRHCTLTLPCRPPRLAGYPLAPFER
ncbi:MAG: hypothetical protein UMU75_10070, partial [Halomonas sp.]|nr:hypothetical protein [Halomonas sp.]